MAAAIGEQRQSQHPKKTFKNFFLKFSSYILTVITKRKKFSKKINKTAVEKKNQTTPPKLRATGSITHTKSSKLSLLPAKSLFLTLPLPS